MFDCLLNIKGKEPTENCPLTNELRCIVLVVEVEVSVQAICGDMYIWVVLRSCVPKVKTFQIISESIFIWRYICCVCVYIYMRVGILFIPF